MWKVSGRLIEKRRSLRGLKIKSDSNNNNKNNVRSAWRPVSGLTHDGMLSFTYSSSLLLIKTILPCIARLSSLQLAVNSAMRLVTFRYRRLRNAVTYLLTYVLLIRRRRVDAVLSDLDACRNGVVFKAMFAASATIIKQPIIGSCVHTTDLKPSTR